MFTSLSALALVLKPERGCIRYNSREYSNTLTAHSFVTQISKHTRQPNKPIPSPHTLPSSAFACGSRDTIVHHMAHTYTCGTPSSSSHPTSAISLPPSPTPLPRPLPTLEVPLCPSPGVCVSRALHRRSPPAAVTPRRGCVGGACSSYTPGLRPQPRVP